ncbi:MAG: glycoside hydrolase family 97 catalytic domain-containing protein [Sphingobacteriaceae bacterium]|nr:glycoside hydrolase family 97 catalytic domain-containing protein [Cytophagaceae bacterium]
MDSLPRYEVRYRQQPVVLPSRLGLKPNLGGVGWILAWDRGLALVRTQTRSQNTTWKPVYGERAEIPDRFNETTFILKFPDPKRGAMQLVVRAYDEGLAFRYGFPEDLRSQIIEFGDEATQFNFPPQTEALYTNRAQGEYQFRPLTGWKQGAELPLTLKLPNGLWASIAQADASNYPRMRLHTENGGLLSRLYSEVTETPPFQLPWRVLLLAEKPGQLLENNHLILSLNPPNALTDVSFIKPGRVMRESTLSTSGAKALVDFAVEQDIDYIHFDAGWYGHEYEVATDARKVDVDPRRNPKKDLDLREAIRYANSKGKGVILYVNHRAMERQLDEILPIYKNWGVAGVKYGFVQTGSHRWVTWLHEAIKRAAQHGLMVDVHDEYMPSGFTRTYPNLMTQEGVHGNEGFPDATHNTVLPFTRYLAGPADYTFCFNVEAIRPGKVKTTKAHQLALPVLFYSPWQFLFWYGTPEMFPNRQEIEFWKGIPTVWDETQVVDGTPGESVVIARRKGAVWYLGGITNTQARELKIPLTFLEGGKTFRATVYEDDGSGGVKKREHRVTSTTALNAKVLASGGVALRIER